ncbi:MAG: DNA repair protein RecO [Elusimicrobiota bacterium]
MLVNDEAIVLRRKDTGEWDRWAVLLTRDHGKLAVRFGGVNRPAGKLKALSESLVWGEYRLCFSLRSSSVRVAGGRIESSFPDLRCDLDRTLQAMSCCEMAMRLSPDRAPCPGKYRLLCRALCLLDQGASPWLETGFGLKLLESAGYSLRDLPVPPGQRGLWRELHEAPLEGLGDVPWYPASGRLFSQLVCDHVEAHAEQPLRCRRVARNMERFRSDITDRESARC